MRSTGPHKAPQSDYTAMMRSSAEFLQMLRQREISPIPVYVAPEIPSRADHTLHKIDNGPCREILTDQTALIQAAEELLSRAVSATVAMVNAMITKDQRHNPWKRPKVGQFTIVELGAADCRFPVTEVGPHFFCGAAVVDGFPYCHNHCQKAFRGMWPKQ